MKLKLICFLLNIIFIISNVFSSQHIRTNNFFFENPDPDNTSMAITYWDFIIDTLYVNILEENEFNKIAIVNCENCAKDKPIIGAFTEGSNTLLNLTVVPIGSKKYELQIEPQDYEEQQEYNFNVIIDDVKINVILKIRDIDDTSPSIKVNNMLCEIPENYEGKSNCSYEIFDPDTKMKDITFIIPEYENDDKFKIEWDETINPEANSGTAYMYVKNLDFETQVMYSFEIQAKDPVNKPATVSIIIRVTDEPDQLPIWNKLFSTQTITEHESAGEVYEVLATDGDIDIKAEIDYRLEGTKSDSLCHKNITIERQLNGSGIIKIGNIDRDKPELKDNTITCNLIAFEINNQTSKVDSDIIFIVQDINDNEPVITLTKDETNFHINEGEITQFENLFSVNDIDQGVNAQFDVKLEDSEDLEDFSKAFQIIPNSAYRSWDFTMTVINTSLLDYENEKWRKFNLTIVATDRGNKPISTEQIITIHLNNLNNNPPEFINDNFIVHIPENATIDTKIITIDAKDKDTDDFISFTLLTNDNNFLLDEITNTSATVKTKKNNVFDFEKQQQAFIQIRINDNLDTSENKDNMHYITQQITIIIDDVNDEKPRISLTDPPEIEEHANDFNGVQYEINAEDPDTTANLIFSINWDDSYATKEGRKINKIEFEHVIDIETVYLNKENTGHAVGKLNIIDKDKLDYELYEVLYLVIKVEDINQEINSGIDQATLSIIIIDINDNYPIFVEKTITSYKFAQEKALSDTVIGSVLAIDKDGPNFNNVTYYLKPKEKTTPGLVKINEISGELTVDENEKIDADPNIYKLLYYVIASDGEKETTAEIEISVIDINDNYPELKESLENQEIEEDKTITTPFLLKKILTKDYDRDNPHNIVNVSLNERYPELFELFEVNKMTGELFAKKGFSWTQENEVITVNLVLTDNIGNLLEHNQVEVNFNLIIIDVNDSPPVLPNTVSFRTINENEKVLENIVAQITADDADKLGTSATIIMYEIIEIKNVIKNITVDKDLFKIENKDNNGIYWGELMVNKKLVGYYGTFSITIKAENIIPDLYDIQTYEFTIEKYNFHSPKIIYPLNDETIILSKEQEIDKPLKYIGGSFLKEFIATDEQDEKYEIIFSNDKDNWSEMFYINNVDKSKAQLLLHQLPNDDNEIESYKLTIKASHNGIGNASSQADPVTFSVYFISVNNLPFFKTTEMSVFIKENLENEYCVDFPEAIDYKCNINKNNCEFITYYYLMYASENTFFNVPHKNNTLCTIKPLDYEESKYHYLTIVASNNEFNPPTNVPQGYTPLNFTVIVLDENDNPPKFDLEVFVGGITTENGAGTTIVELLAFDVDENDTMRFEIVNNSMKVSDDSLKNTNEPFKINEFKIISNFKPTKEMQGYFEFKVMVFDSNDLHNDSAGVKIFIISEKDKTEFIFENKVSAVKEKYVEVTQIFSRELEYNCSIDSITEKYDDSGHLIEDRTELKVHFFDPISSELISEDDTNKKINDEEIIISLTSSFKTIGLKLISIKNNIIDEIKNESEILRIILIVVSVVLTTLIVILIISFFLRTRSLKNRIESMTTNIFGSTKSDLNRIGINAPGTNRHAVEANPVWNEDINENQDRLSQSSDDSDLIGIEENPEFSYNSGKDNINPAATFYQNSNNINNNIIFKSEDDDDINSLPDDKNQA